MKTNFITNETPSNRAGNAENYVSTVCRKRQDENMCNLSKRPLSTPQHPRAQEVLAHDGAHV